MKLISGHCRSTNRTLIELHIHSYVSLILIGFASLLKRGSYLFCGDGPGQESDRPYHNFAVYSCGRRRHAGCSSLYYRRWWK